MSKTKYPSAVAVERNPAVDMLIINVKEKLRQGYAIFSIETTRLCKHVKRASTIGLIKVNHDKRIKSNQKQLHEEVEVTEEGLLGSKAQLNDAVGLQKRLVLNKKLNRLLPYGYWDWRAVSRQVNGKYR